MLGWILAALLLRPRLWVCVYGRTMVAGMVRSFVMWGRECCFYRYVLHCVCASRLSCPVIGCTAGDECLSVFSYR